MLQPKLQLQLPTHLLLSHFVDRPQLLPKPCISVSASQESEQIALRLSSISSDQSSKYNNDFILNFILIKINSWLTYSSFQSYEFITRLQHYYNQLLCDPSPIFRQSRNDGELMSQILLKSEAYKYMEMVDLDEILEGSALVGSSVIETYKIVEKIIGKCYFNVVLGTVSLRGRTDPYIPIVHAEKNHWGQIQFSRRINQLIHLKDEISNFNKEIIQDAYSLRCSPQVHGVSLECLGLLKERIQGMVSKPQTRYIVLNGKKLRNLSLRSQKQTLLLDNLIFALNEIGHMSFLRAQRILNKYLGKNGIEKNQHYGYLMSQLKKISYLVCENKLLCVPSNSDTILFNNYQHDVYVNQGSAYKRLSSMVANIRKIFKVELMGAVEVILSMHGRCSIFKNQEMQATLEGLVGLSDDASIRFGEGVQNWLLM